MDTIIEGSICGLIGAFVVPTVNALRLGIAPNNYTYSWYMLCGGFIVGIMYYNNMEAAKQLVDIPPGTFKKERRATEYMSNHKPILPASVSGYYINRQPLRY